MEQKEIKFKDLSLGLKIAVIFAWTAGIGFSIGFLIGFLGAL